MVSQVTEVYDLCPELGGITVNIACVSAPNGVISRTGAPHQLNLESRVSGSNGSYIFEIPREIFTFPVGYYDLSVYDGALLKKVIRLNLHTTGMALPSSEVESNCPDKRSVEPNVELVVQCMCHKCGIEKCCPDTCEDATLVVLDTGSFEEGESVPSEVDLYNILTRTISHGSFNAVKTLSGGVIDCTHQIRTGRGRTRINEVAAARNLQEAQHELLIRNATKPDVPYVQNDPNVVDPSLADVLNQQFIDGER